MIIPIDSKRLKIFGHSGKTRFFQMAPNIFGLRRVLRRDTFSSFGSFRDVKPSLACFLKLCSCAMFACGCAMFACGYESNSLPPFHYLLSFVEWWDFAWVRHVFPIAPCFCRCTVFLLMRQYFCVFGLCQKFWEQDSLGMKQIQCRFPLSLEPRIHVDAP